MNINPEILTKEERLIFSLREIFESYGFKKYRMNRFEEYGLYMNNKDFLVSESVISFTNLDGKLLALKPDVTLSIVKHAQSGEQRLYYIENVYRPDKAKRSFIEIGQMGLERIGKIDNYAIAETIILAAKSLYAISKDSLLEVSHMGFVFGLLKYYNIAGEDISFVIKLISGKNSKGIYDFAICRGIDENGAKTLSSIPYLFGSFDDVLEKAQALCVNDECRAALNQLQTIGEIICNVNNISDVRVDFSLVGGVDYYNGIVFAGYVKGLPSRVLAGGQYDRILKKFAKNGGAIGFALYLNEISFIFSSKSDYDCDIIVKYSSDTDILKLNEYISLLIEEGKSVYPVEITAVTEIRAKEEILFIQNCVEEAE